MKAYIETLKKGFKTKAEQAAFWQRVAADQAKSHMTMLDFCERHQLSLRSFKYWKYRLKEKSKENKETASTFIPIAIHSVEANTEAAEANTEASLSCGTTLMKLTVVLKNGVLIHLTARSSKQLAEIISSISGCVC